MPRNMRVLDRLTRLVLGLLAIEQAYFWLHGALQIGAYVAGGILVVTALAGVCPLYKALGFGAGAGEARAPGRALRAAVILAGALVLVAGGYASDFVSRKHFLEDFNAMNQHYKQALFHTGREDRAAASAAYDALAQHYGRFHAKYSAYRPHALRGDARISDDLARVAAIVAGAAAEVRGGDLQKAHVALEAARPVFQDIFKRNRLSLLAVALIEFHDHMELVLQAANARDAFKVRAMYAQASESLKAVEAQANDAEIKAIRQALDDLAALAEAGRSDALPALAEQLKRSFVKVYLARG